LFSLIILVINYIYRRIISKKIDNYIAKEYILILVKIIHYFHITKNNYSIILLQLLIFIYLDKLLIKVEYGSKLIVSNFILKEITYAGKYLSQDYKVGNAVEFFIIESLFLFNTITIITKYQKNIIDYIMIMIGLLPLYIIMKNFLYLWHYFIQCVYIFFCTKTVYFFIYWFIIMGLFFYFNSTFIPKLYLKKIIKRKIYHFLGLIVLVPGIMFLDRNVFKLILMIISYLFIVVEIIRNIEIVREYSVFQNLNNFMQKSIDERDDSGFIITHIFLMTGLVSSLYYDDNGFMNNNSLSYLSVIVLGIGDAMCSICGVSFGRNKIYSLNDRTLEGTLGGLISSIVFYMMLYRNIIGIKVFIQFALVFLYEGFTLEIDNLVLPLFANNLFLNFDLIKNKIQYLILYSYLYNSI
jgi:dolichol kinase